MERIKQAATLGGASEFIERLGDGYDTYLDRPVRDYYSGLPEGTMNLFGRSVSFGRIRGMGGMKSNESTSLSGGQMQRIALYDLLVFLMFQCTESWITGHEHSCVLQQLNLV